MVSLYFGVPGCGKTTTAVKLAVSAVVSIASGRSKYKRVFVNFDCNYPFVTKVPFDFIGKFDMSDSLIIIDEATLYVDNRDYKSFPEHLRNFFLLHRHYGCDIALFCQQWDAVDKKIRTITEKVYYIKKSPFFPWRSIIYPLQYGIYIPSSASDKDAEFGEISQGYKLPGLIPRIFAERYDRRRYYHFFDSFQRPELPPLPEFLSKADK